ncbi:hypothetical protein NUW58_g4872 [Xylaria curta]|uniref:Uncharacterized protein n=1 Tax=Xylaria curta TaxID=42375 RepID=A0ACC1P597_9PEZI|nr:hypothetical protein NUW58_g4872 [Xylaria curta]
MSTPLDDWIHGSAPHLPFDVAFEIAESISSPRDLQRKPIDEDPESNPQHYLPPIQNGPIPYDSSKEVIFQYYSKRVMDKFFSDDIKRQVLLILFMPNPSNRIYNVEFRTQYPQVGDPNPYPLLAQRRQERFQKYYIDPEYQDSLFTFKNLNRISPYYTAINLFATDFAKKALSDNPSLAHHCPPSFAHNSLNLQDETWQKALRARDSSEFSDLKDLHETEQERLKLAFYQYEAMCCTSARVSGYPEIRHATDAMVNNEPIGVEGWNANRAQQSPLDQESGCQIERVASVYYYVRLQYLLIFHALWYEYSNYLQLCETEAKNRGFAGTESRNWGDSEIPQIFDDKSAQMEWIDILCSKGLLFLYEILNMDAERRREFLVRSYYPQRARFDHLMNRDHLVKGVFHALSPRPAVDNTFTSDQLEDASEPNLAWVRYNTVETGGRTRILLTDYCDETNNALRRTGYVFWNADRCLRKGFDQRNTMLALQHENMVYFGNGPGYLDSAGRRFTMQSWLEYVNKPKAFLDIVLRHAGQLYMTPRTTPQLIEFGVLGETWRTDANLLIAFVAFFLTVVTAQLWSIACFASHAFFSTQSPRDMLHYQRQAILRNNGAPAGTAITLIRLAWAWRRSSGVVGRVTPLLACTVLLAIGFAAAAGFSSRIAQSTVVLLRPRNCSTRAGTALTLQLATDVYFPWLAKQHTIALNYAQQCYSASETVADCINTAFVRRELATSVDRNASCPFDTTVCSSNSSNIRLDSGFIDSHFDLGVNAPPDQRFLFRTVLHCAPLTTTGYRSSHTRSDNQTLSRYHYGITAYQNFTYQYPTPGQAMAALDNDTLDEGSVDGSYLNKQYYLVSAAAYPFNGSYLSRYAFANFLPIPQLSRYDADIDLLFLSPNQVAFPQPTADPWYNSSQSGSLWRDAVPLEGAEIYNDSVRMYLSTEAASPLGCTRRLQYCFPELPAGQNCTLMMGNKDSAFAALRLGIKNETTRRLGWIHNSFFAAMPTLQQIGQTLGSSSLTSRFKLVSGMQGLLPSHQWQLEVENWNSILLTLYQQSMISTVLGDFPEYLESDIEKYVRYAELEEEKTICSNQKINSAYHVSFSVLGIALIALIGLLIIVTSLSIEPITHFIQRRLKRSTYRRLDWISTGTLQVQRQLFEAHGVNPWRGCDEMIPILEEQGALLPVLDISDETHPLMKRRSQLAGGPKEARTERPSETELPDESDAPGDQDNAGRQGADIEQNHREAMRYDALAPTGTAPVDDERTNGLEILAAISELRDHGGPVSVNDALERRTNTYP